MKLTFSKMHGAGNDFIAACEDKERWPTTPAFIQKICNRHRGIGADGLILLSSDSQNADAKMRFFNCDGSSAEMCGNALRCAGLFAFRHIKKQRELLFETEAGILLVEIITENIVRIELPVLEDFSEYILDGKKLCKGNTGVPHAVSFVDDAEKIDITREGPAIRFHKLFAPEGANANFISFPKKESDPIKIRTYERGVEAETLACGTGIAAAAICANKFASKKSPMRFIAKDKDILSVELIINENIVRKVKLSGPTVEVFEGKLAQDALK